MPPYMWMPPVHKQQKESMLCQTKGGVHMPHTFGCPMFGHPLYVWMLPMFGRPHMFDAPVWLGAPNAWTPPYVWMMFECPLYIHNAKKECFVRLRGYPYATIHLDAPVCLDATICLDASLYVWMLPYASCMFGHPHMFGYPLYVWMPPIFGHPSVIDAPHVGHPLFVWILSLCFVAFCMFGCPLNLWGYPKV